MSEEQMHVEDAMDSRLAKTAVRVFVWLMPWVFTGLISLVVWQLREIRAEQRTSAAAQQKQSEATAAIASDVRDLNTRFDLIAVQKLEALEKRVDRIEQVTRTP